MPAPGWTTTPGDLLITIISLSSYKILIDSSLSKYENVYAAAGHPNSIFKITYKQLVKLTKGKEEDIV